MLQVATPNVARVYKHIIFLVLEAEGSGASTVWGTSRDEPSSTEVLEVTQMATMTLET